MVLDQSWRAINVVPVHKAVCMVFTREHLIVDTETFTTYGFEEWLDRGVVEGRPIQTVNSAFDAPRVVVTTAIQKFLKTKVNLNKSTVCKRDGHKCQYCGKTFPDSGLSLDHVVPKSQGGKLTWDNTVAACLKCNVAKGGRTPKQAGMKLLCKPEEPRWSPLFAKRVQSPPDSWGKFLSKPGGGV